MCVKEISSSEPPAIDSFFATPPLPWPSEGFPFFSSLRWSWNANDLHEHTLHTHTHTKKGLCIKSLKIIFSVLHKKKLRVTNNNVNPHTQSCKRQSYVGKCHNYKRKNSKTYTLTLGILSLSFIQTANINYACFNSVLLMFKTCYCSFKLVMATGPSMQQIHIESNVLYFHFFPTHSNVTRIARFLDPFFSFNIQCKCLPWQSRS